MQYAPDRRPGRGSALTFALRVPDGPLPPQTPVVIRLRAELGRVLSGRLIDQGWNGRLRRGAQPEKGPIVGGHRVRTAGEEYPERRTLSRIRCCGRTREQRLGFLARLVNRDLGVACLKFPRQEVGILVHPALSLDGAP
jgi:hypothetical protein